MHSYFRSDSPPLPPHPTNSIILTHHPNPFHDSLRSSQSAAAAAAAAAATGDIIYVDDDDGK